MLPRAARPKRELARRLLQRLPTSVCMRLLLSVPYLASPIARQNLPDSPQTVSKALSFPPIRSSDTICLAVGNANGGRRRQQGHVIVLASVSAGVWPRNRSYSGQAGYLYASPQLRWHSVRLWPKGFTETLGEGAPPGVSACDEIDICRSSVTGQDTQVLQIARGYGEGGRGRGAYQAGMDSDPTGERRHSGR